MASATRSALFSAASLVALMPASALAQVVEQPGGEAQGEVVVTGTRASLENAERVKRNANVILDGVSADDISALPDASISESLVRITGVTSNDNPRGPNDVSIRGLGPDLTLTTVNGRVLTTGSSGDRRIGLAQLPSEGISGAYVQKTADAATLEGAVAGVLDLRTIRPLEAKGRGLTLVGRALFHDNSGDLSAARHYGKTGARAEATYVGRLTPNLGVAVTYSYLHQYSGFGGVQVDNWRLGTGARTDVNGDGRPDALPTNVGVTSNFNDDERHSAVGMIQWDGGDGIAASLDSIYIRDRLYVGPNRFFANNIFNGVANGAATSTTVDGFNAVQQFSGLTALYRMALNEQKQVDETMGGGLKVQIERGPIKAVFDASVYRTTRDAYAPNATIENDATNANAQRLTFGYDITDPSAVTLTFNPLVADDYALSQLTETQTDVKDVSKAVRADFRFTPARTDLFQSIDFGARVDRRDHSNAVDASQYSWSSLTTRPDLDASHLQTTTNPYQNASGLFGGSGGVNFPYFDIRKVLPLRTAPGVVSSNQFSNDIAGTYDIREDTAAIYGQINVDAGRAKANAGLRWVVTDTRVRGQSGTTPANVTSLTFNNSYKFLLPSANVRYDITRQLLGRIAYSETFARQQFDDLAVSSAVDLTTIPTGVLTINRGNPNLRPFTAKSFDVSLEWNPNRATYVAAAIYYKRLRNFLVVSTTPTTVTLTNGTTVPAIIISQTNDPANRYLRGVELNVRRDFDFLPGPLGNLGVQFNLNYNGTSIKQTVASLVGTTAPSAPDQFSKFVYNGQLYYSTKKLDLRVAYRHFDPYIRAFFGSYQEQPDGQLDISGGWTFYRNFRVIGSVTNVLKARMRRFVPDSRNLANKGLIQLSVYQGRQASIGLRATF